ncbi:MAG: hypothetical protein RR508_05150 [Oscillospiraceae bacterium]
MIESIINIIAAILACLGCVLVLTATINLARRRFFAPEKDKKIWIIAVSLLCVSALIFSPTKSINRDVKQALASVNMAVRRTAYAKSATVTCQKLNMSGDVLSSCEYLYTRTQNEHRYTVTDTNGENVWKGEDTISLFENGFVDTGYGRVDEKVLKDGQTFHFLKNLKQLTAQKRIVLSNMQKTLDAKIPVFKNGKAMTEAEQAAIQRENAAICKAYKKCLKIYQWEETYKVDKSGYISEWEIFCDAKDKDGKRVQCRYVYKVTEIVKDK